eukprot:scaffold391362_cov73-Cyclotella_meneghiniana.AAC.2
MVVSLSHYDLLGIAPNATEEDIKAAYRMMSKSMHPDRNRHGKTLMQQINTAKEILLDRSKRSQYDSGELLNHQSEQSTRGSSSYEVRRLRTEVASLQQQLNTSERKLANAQRSQANMRNRLNDLECTNTILEDDLSNEKRLHKQLQNKHKKIEKQMTTLKATNARLEKENHDNTRRIDKYEGKMERISRELREERRDFSTKLAAEKNASYEEMQAMKKTLSKVSVCYQCDGKATSEESCKNCKGSGAVQGHWTKCHNCDGSGYFSSINGEKVSCTICSGKGAREGVLNVTCFKCKGKKNLSCNLCSKGKIRGFNYKLCPICNGKDANECENCRGRAYVTCQCGSECKGHRPNQISKVEASSSLQKSLTLGSGDGDEKPNTSESDWKPRFLSRNWGALTLHQNEVKGVFI